VRSLALLAAVAAALSLPVAATTASAPAASGAVWAPDGKTVAFQEQTPDGRVDVYTVRADGTELRNVTADDKRAMLYTPQPAPHYLPAWSPGARLAYVVDRGTYTQRVFEYWVANADGTAKHLVTTQATEQRPSWSPDSVELALESFEAIVTARVSDGAVRSTIAPAGYAVWSPRDPRIAVSASARASSDNLDVYTVRADGSHRHRLTTARGSDWPVAWSRDARRIVFATQRLIAASNGRTHIVALYVMDANGRHQHRVGTGEAADFSPNGERVVYSDGKRVYVVGVDDRHRRLLVSDGVDPKWSPDGRWISFTSGATVQLVRADGTGRRTLAP